MDRNTMMMWVVLALMVSTAGLGYLYVKEEKENIQLRADKILLEADKQSLWEQKQYFKDESESNMMKLLEVQGDLKDMQDQEYARWKTEQKQTTASKTESKWSRITYRDQLEYPPILGDEPLTQKTIDLLMRDYFKKEAFDSIEYITVEFTDCETEMCVMGRHYYGNQNHVAIYINKNYQLDGLIDTFHHEMRHRYDYVHFGEGGDNSTQEPSKHFIEQNIDKVNTWMLKQPLPTEV